MSDGIRNHRSPSMRDAARSIVERLQANGHQAFFAGGCVRDMLMGRDPTDYDVATSAPPEAVIGLFKKTQKVGAAFGVVLVRIGRISIEVATFRRDAPYADGRHPTAVEFTDAREDALRRDFTINGLFLDPMTDEVVDYVGGRADIEARLIRAIGEPSHRFAEDHLRLLRAIRFAARLDFQFESATWQAMREHAAQIARISPERIREELEAIFSASSRRTGFAFLCDSDLMQHLWPGSAQVLSQRNRIEAALDALPVESGFEATLAVLLSHLTGSSSESTCDALRCSNAVKRRAHWLHKNQNALRDPASLTLADLKLLMQDECFADLLAIFRAQLIANAQPLDPYKATATRASTIDPNDVSPPPLITGHDLTALGVPRGPQYRRILDRIYYMQLNEELRTSDEAHAALRNLLNASKT